MTLEDFFTLNEMKGGFTVPSRVEELVNVIWKEKDRFSKNVVDVARQWAAVASTIAATENRDCLDLFVQLDGLCFIHGWLKDVQTFSSETDDSSMEETITLLLQALEKLQISNERSVSSGILITVKNLLGHSSRMVQDRARVLCDSWNNGVDHDAVKLGLENVSVLHDDGNDRNADEDGRSSTIDDLSTNDVQQETCVPEANEDQMMSLKISDTRQPEEIAGLKIPNYGTGHHSHTISECSDVKAESALPLSSADVSNCNLENASQGETSTFPVKETSTIGTSGSPIQEKVCAEELLDGTALTDYEKVADETSDKIGMAKTPSASKQEGEFISLGDVTAYAQESVIKPAAQKAVDTNESKDSRKITANDTEETPACDSKSEMDAIGVMKCSRSEELRTASEDHGICPNNFSHLSDNMSSDSATSSSRMEDFGELNGDKDHSHGSEELMSHSNILKPALDFRSMNAIEKRSDMDLDYGIVDALEVARQVAQEVEREVVNYNREPSSSSSSEKIIAEVKQGDNEDGRNRAHGQQTDIRPLKVPVARSNSTDECSDGPDNMDTEAEKLDCDVSSHQNEAVQKNVNVERGFSAFDLNQEVSSDDLDGSVDPNANGNLGGEGPASAGAFCAASSDVSGDDDEKVSAREVSGKSKQRSDFIAIDLNVAEAEDELGTQILLSSAHPSGIMESSVQGIPKRSVGLGLDLNLRGDDPDTPASGQRLEGGSFDNRPGPNSSSPAFPVSWGQPLMKNFDLNDKPLILNGSSWQGHMKSSQDVSVNATPRTEASYISIMGTRVEVSRKDPFPHAVSLPNGKSAEHGDASIARTVGVSRGMVPAVSYFPTPLFGYNGLTEGQMMSFGSNLYGHGGTIPYMVDSRGAVVHQILGSASALPPPAYSQPPYMMTGAQLAVGGTTAQTCQNFDMNAGLVMEGLNRDPGMQYFLPVQGRSIDNSRNNSLPLTSALGSKRKEPDGRWDPHPFGYKLQQPPWK